MKRTYWILSLILLVIIAAAGWFYLSKKKAAVTEYKTAKVERGDIQLTVKASGTLQAVTTVQVGTQVSGIIKQIYVDYNSVVKQGQVIAVLDTILLAQAVEDARVSLRRAEIQENQNRRDYDRTKSLFEQKVMAQADYDLALTTWETATANVISARSALNRSLINLRYATIIAPISGVVVSRAVDVGQTVAASFSTPTMFTIANDLTKMQVQANIDEGDIGKIKMDQQVTFTVDAYPDQTFEGRVSQVRLLPVVSQTVVNYTVIIDVPNPDLKLLPGMTANITVLVQEEKDVLIVPSTALRFKPPQEYIEALMKSRRDTTNKKQNGRSAEAGATASRSSGREGGPPGGPPGMEGGMPGMGGGPMGSGGWGHRSGSGFSGRSGMGTLWVKVGDSLKPRRVRIGITDGLNTEVRGRIEEGDEVVLSMTTPQTTQASASTQQQSPFAPQAPRSSRDRGGR